MRLDTPQLSLKNNRYTIFSKVKGTVKIRLERIDIQKEIIVEALLDSRTTGLVISLEFAKK